MKQVLSYEASDGTLFAHKAECIQFEVRKELREAIRDHEPTMNSRAVIRFLTTYAELVVKYLDSLKLGTVEVVEPAPAPPAKAPAKAPATGYPPKRLDTRCPHCSEPYSMVATTDRMVTCPGCGKEYPVKKNLIKEVKRECGNCGRKHIFPKGIGPIWGFAACEEFCDDHDHWMPEAEPKPHDHNDGPQ